MSSAKRAINLARVSTPAQAKAFSLEFQLEQERAYDSEMGFAIVAEFKDDVSGRILERDGLETASRMLENDEADVLVVWNFDRLHRSYVNSVLMRDRIRKAGKHIHYVKARMISGQKALDRLPEELQLLWADVESEIIAQRTMQGKIDTVVKAGRFLGLGKAPYAYKKVGKGKELVIVVDPETAAVVVLIYDWYVFGEDDIPPMNTQQIAERLTSWGLPTPMDLLPDRAHLRKRPAGVWDRNSVTRILRESAYNGTFYQFKKKKDGAFVKMNPNRDEWLGVSFPVIVKAETWKLAQEKLDRGREPADRGAIFEYLVGRRIRCECGYKLSSTTSHCVWKSKKTGEVQDRHYSRYRCLGRTKDVVKNGCTMPLLPAGKVDQLAWEFVGEELANPDVLERKLKEIQAEQQAGNAGLHERLETLEKHQEEIERNIKRLIAVLARQEIPEYLGEQVISEENQKLNLTISEINKLKREMETPLADSTISDLLSFSAALQSKLETVGKTFAGRRTIIDGLDVTVEAFREGSEVYIRLKSILNPNGILRSVFSPSRTTPRR
jgi:site-specific DNA recombinase